MRSLCGLGPPSSGPVERPLWRFFSFFFFRGPPINEWLIGNDRVECCWWLENGGDRSESRSLTPRALPIRSCSVTDVYYCFSEIRDGSFRPARESAVRHTERLDMLKMRDEGGLINSFGCVWIYGLRNDVRVSIHHPSQKTLSSSRLSSHGKLPSENWTVQYLRLIKRTWIKKIPTSHLIPGIYNIYI